MENLLSLKAAIAAAAICAPFSAGGAAAQSTANSQLAAPAPTVVETVSAADITGFIESLEIAIAPYEDGVAETFTLMATAQTGGQFLMTLFGCADPATGADCEGFSTYAGFSNAGLAYDDLNRFNTESSVSKAINIADQNAVIFGVQQYATGGVSLANMQFVTVLFLNDLNKFMTSPQNIQRSVALAVEEDAPTKTGNNFSAEKKVAPAPFEFISIDGAIASAINNTSDVGFDVAPR